MIDFQRILHEWRHAPKLKAADPNDDDEFIDRIAHAMKPREKLMEWVSRVCLSKAQVMQMSAEEIRLAAERSDELNREAGFAAFEPKRMPRHFLIDLFD
jgi:hypothetical protein